jgi:hypothetical protein
MFLLLMHQRHSLHFLLEIIRCYKCGWYVSWLIRGIDDLVKQDGRRLLHVMMMVLLLVLLEVIILMKHLLFSLLLHHLLFILILLHMHSNKLHSR